MRNTKPLMVLKYSVYTVYMLLLYILQNVPGLFEVRGVKPIWVIPAAVALAMFEGEFVGGVYGALAGLLCDMGSFLLFGFNGFLVCVSCIAIGLLVIYLMHGNLINCLLFVLVLLLLRGSLDYFFSYGMWGYEGAWKIYTYHYLPVIAYSTLISPLLYWVAGKLHGVFASALQN